MKKKGRSSVVPTAIIIGTSASLMAGWSWHSIPGYEIEPGNHVAARAFSTSQSELMVEVTGTVVRLIGNNDSVQGLQWFQMRTPSGQRLMVAHDNGLQGPIPLSPRDEITVRGGYEWTESGGTIRNTERDHSLKRLHGWVEHKGKRYD